MKLVLTVSRCSVVVLGALCALSGCDGHPLRPANGVPRLLEPLNGTATGSFLASANLRPTFRWQTLPGVDDYQLQIGRDCAAPIASCELGGVAVDVRVSGGSFPLPADLEVSRTAPVGARYHWRVRGCPGGQACGDWSAVFYVDVGRERADFDGDGYADIATSTQQPPSALVFFGGPPGMAPRTATLDVSRGALQEVVNVQWAGDVDGDGFGDLAVSQYAGNGQSGRVRVVGGSAAGAQRVTILSLDADGPVGSTMSATDVNWDGFADLAVCGMSSPLIALGPNGGEQISLAAAHGYAGWTGSWCGASTDFDGDGFGDVWLGGMCSGADCASGVFFGGQHGSVWSPSYIATGDIVDPAVSAATSSLPGVRAVAVGAVMASQPAVVLLAPRAGRTDSVASAAVVIRPPPEELAAAPRPDFGASLASWPSPAAGGNRLVVGFPSRNRVFVYDLSVAGAPLMGMLLGTQHDGVRDMTGAAAATPGDVDGNGYADIVVGNPYNGIDSVLAGEVYLLVGGPSLPATWAATLVGAPAAKGVGLSVD